MKLVDNWHSAWKWFSLQALGIGGVLQIAFIAMPADMRAFVPDTWMHWIAVGTLLASALGRFVDQTKAGTA